MQTTRAGMYLIWGFSAGRSIGGMVNLFAHQVTLFTVEAARDGLETTSLLSITVFDHEVPEKIEKEKYPESSHGVHLLIKPAMPLICHLKAVPTQTPFSRSGIPTLSPDLHLVGTSRWTGNITASRCSTREPGDYLPLPDITNGLVSHLQLLLPSDIFPKSFICTL